MDIRGQSANLQATLEQFREDIQRLNGRIEETAHQLNIAVDGLKDRIERLERYINVDRPAVGSPGLPDLTTGPEPVPQASEEPEPERERGLRFPTRDRIPPPVRSPEPTPGERRPLSVDDRYAMAKQRFDRGDYESARKAFRELIRTAPRSPHADNAQFWIGETHYRERQYEEAILAYQNVIEQYPDGNKVRASLLKQGLAFYMLGDKPNARRILEALIHQYPNSSEANIARNKLRAW
jgi:tol-pal system protein YbgF